MKDLMSSLKIEFKTDFQLFELDYCIKKYLIKKYIISAKQSNCM